MQPAAHRFCVAPMMDVTDRHCRCFLRRLSRHARLGEQAWRPGATERVLAEALARVSASAAPETDTRRVA